MASTQFVIQSILLFCVILFSRLPLHHCDESRRVDANLATEICIPLLSPGSPPEWCCTLDKPATCGYVSPIACHAKCH
ncbi:hypothetical protein P3S68_021722 [Capsicum galapagoense]